MSFYILSYRFLPLISNKHTNNHTDAHTVCSIDLEQPSVGINHQELAIYPGPDAGQQATRGADLCKTNISLNMSAFMSGRTICRVITVIVSSPCYRRIKSVLSSYQVRIVNVSSPSYHSIKSVLSSYQVCVIIVSSPCYRHVCFVIHGLVVCFSSSFLHICHS